jgi:plasmid replication initiation protein
VGGERSEPAEVWLADGRPARFGWRGRLYTVLAILERPAASGATAATGQQEPATPGRDDPTTPGRDHPSAAGHAAGDWECWRVAASPGRSILADVYRLCHNRASGSWILSRTAR